MQSPSITQIVTSFLAGQKCRYYEWAQYLLDSQYFVDLPWTKKFGNNQKRDQIEIVFSGLSNVHIPARFDLMDCLQSANIGVYLSHDESLNVKEENKVKCVAWERHIYN